MKKKEDSSHVSRVIERDERPNNRPKFESTGSLLLAIGWKKKRMPQMKG